LKKNFLSNKSFLGPLKILILTQTFIIKIKSPKQPDKQFKKTKLFFQDKKHQFPLENLAFHKKLKQEDHFLLRTKKNHLILKISFQI
jgi:hypothetical protein